MNLVFAWVPGHHAISRANRSSYEILFLGQAFRGPSRGPAELKDEKHVSEFDHECLNK